LRQVTEVESEGLKDFVSGALIIRMVLIKQYDN